MSVSVSDVLGWVKEAYAGGVPAEDAAALVAVLRQRLGSTATLQATLQLVADGVLPAAAAASGASAPIEAADLRRVSAQLVMGGWPLATPGSDSEDDDTEEGSYLGRIVAWLREGYPTGVPEHDYIPLLAILQRRLTSGEVKKVAKALRRNTVGPASMDDIAAAISDVTHAQASEPDLLRVRDRLAAKGWPVDFPDPDA